IYHSYSAFINTSKSLLLTKDIKPSSQHQTMNDFQEVFVNSGDIELPFPFREFVLRINKNEPTQAFAADYLESSEKFLADVQSFRNTSKEMANEVR
ncbi:MAG: nitrite reductase, partial [Cyclobacteriaceae bacterium]|nr:nitrite reductase [Cyclobacteriaceae bacterium]